MSKFSERYGYEPQDTEITVREDAPHNLRGAVVSIAYEAGLSPQGVRAIVCSTLRERENDNNWSDDPVDGEVRDHLDSCQWYEVYGIIEAIHAALSPGLYRGDPNLDGDLFQREINRLFRRDGIGWQLVDGEVRTRGPEDFEETVREAGEILLAAGRGTAASEIHEALSDLSRRPDPDLTGALHHGLAALECVMRDVCGDQNATLGALLKRHAGVIPPPVDQALGKIWGFASEQGRHVREGRTPGREEVELAVHMAAAAAIYLTKKFP